MTQAPSLAAPPPVRCAVYTRKSTEEGLQQEFNSLDAQRESGAAYVASQKHDGWVCLPQSYDDGGYTGANVERPALRRLLADIEAGRVDCVVVYKVDRLSRSLLDFARLMHLFDERRVAFVSVTQSFNSATSMGRLVLNVLLSFAQFEREIISERTRDKIAATRRKGKWTGGHPPLGYHVDPVTTKLAVVEQEAQRVRAIFGLYLEHQALLPVVRELSRREWRTKGRVTRAGRQRPGRPFDRTNLHRLLTSALYTGKVSHKGQLYPGEHAALVEPEVFEQVQQLLRQKRPAAAERAPNRFGASLMGRLRCGPCQRAMTPSHTGKARGLSYRYYTCTAAQKRGRECCPNGSVPAGEIEAFVSQRVRGLLQDPDLLAQVLASHEGASEATPFEPVVPEFAARRLAELAAGWESLPAEEEGRVVRRLVRRVDYDRGRGKVAIAFDPTGLRELIAAPGPLTNGALT